MLGVREELLMTTSPEVDPPTIPGPMEDTPSGMFCEFEEEFELPSAALALAPLINPEKTDAEAESGIMSGNRETKPRTATKERPFPVL